MAVVSASKEMDRPGKIIVTGIPKNETFTEADLEKEFSPFGRITEVYLVKNKRTNVLRGFAFITYENPKDALDAMKAMEGKNLGGDKGLHCEQAVLGAKMRQQNAEEESKGRGRGRGNPPGRGGRGGEMRGRGGDMRGRGGDIRGRGGDMRGRGGDMWGRGGEMRGRGGEMRGRGGFREEYGRGGYRGEDYGHGGYRGDEYGRGGYRGEDNRRGGLRGGRGGEFYEEDYGMEEDHGFEDVRGPSRPPLLGRGGGRPGRKTLLPDPNMLGARRGQYEGGGPRHGQYDGGEEYYEEGVGDYEEGGYDYNEYSEQEEYSEHYEERRPMRGGPGRMQPPRRGGMEPPRQRVMEPARPGGAEPGRRGMEPPRQGLMDPPRRGGMPPRRRGPEFEEEEERTPQRPDGRYSRTAGEEYGGKGEGWLPQRRGEEDYGYQDQGHEQGGDYWDNGYREEGTSQRAAPRGRPVSARGGNLSSGQRRRPLLGEDPFTGSAIQAERYGRRQPQMGEMRQDGYDEEDNYNTPSYGRRPTPANSRQPPARPDDRYREGGPDGIAMRGGGGSRGPRNHPQEGEGDRYEEEGYYDKAAQGVITRRDDYGEGRRLHQVDRGYDFDSNGRKRPMEEDGRGFSENIAALHRQYEDMLERAGGPSSAKRDRYDGYYQ